MYVCMYVYIYIYIYIYIYVLTVISYYITVNLRLLGQLTL